ncbi:MAG: Smr/MutS family protein [Gemmatimonadota bacterium]
MATGLTGQAPAALPHGLQVLEFAEVLRAVASHAASAAGVAHLLDLRPSSTPSLARERLAQADEMVSLVLRHDWVPARIPNVLPALRRLAVAGSVLDEDDLLAVAALLAASRSVRADLRRDPRGLPRLAALAESLVADAQLEKRIAGSFAASGGLADGASRELRRLRGELRGSRSRLVKRLEQFCGTLPDRFQVADASITLRAGRYCIPIRREAASRVGGIVHDESATHQTLFVEPPMAIEDMNRIAALDRDESREVRRILAELTESVRPIENELALVFEALAEADSLQARARFALAHGGSRPELFAFDSTASLEIIDAVHPLLLVAGEPAVPFSLRLAPEEKVLLISGPNAGGKTVTLKALGLLSALAQSGVIPPVGSGTRLPVFDDFFAVIGDEQSISASLSTFSAQVAALGQILHNAGAASLVLLDEIGGNTDPAEGAALAAAVLLRLSAATGLTVATTHLGALKQLAAETPAVVNASLQFDAVALRPSFVLIRDRPGRSYALEIASRLGLPAELVEAARGRLGSAELRMEQVLKQLEDTEAELRELTSGARAETRTLTRRESELDDKARKLAEREQALEREARSRAERYLLEARRDVERAIEELRDVAEDSGSDAVREARRTVEELIRANRAAGREAADRFQPREALALDPRPGDVVASRSLGVTGRVAEIRPGQVVLEAGGVRLTLAIDDLQAPPAGADRRTDSATQAGVRLPDIEAHPKVDLRGLRVDEVSGPLLAAVDAAVVTDLRRLLVIHGKGTGALKKEVTRLLREDLRVVSLRPGGFDEGGFGVTVVDLKGGAI